ncbi:hypothetical protein MTR62_13050 [Novosphingobium sp. 1949]|uniref:MoaF-like domain-containing protein n=1 Tax=Novosphingobium organovorum TaxID=2930092 RepID=A0ABT0BF00_9SPHN|nr:hypothetical protein [Novosphingobium organovorum]MCJ2183611.1 hypothetical protein [Novosphingobium organovorum]
MSVPTYPVGQTWIFDIGPARVAQDVLAPDRIRFRILTGDRAGESGEFAIVAETLGPDCFLVSWQEADGHAVVHHEDHAARRFKAVIVTPDGRMLRAGGEMEQG